MFTGGFYLFIKSIAFYLVHILILIFMFTFMFFSFFLVEHRISFHKRLFSCKPNSFNRKFFNNEFSDFVFYINFYWFCDEN